MSKDITVDTTTNVIAVESETQSNVSVSTEQVNNAITIESDNSNSVTVIETVTGSVSLVETISNNIELTQEVNVIEIADSVSVTTVVPDDNIAITAAEAIAANDIVVINSSGEAELADNSDLTQITGAYGFAQVSAAAGQSVTITLSGLITTTGLTLGASLFVGNSGALTQTEPTTGYLKIIGKPLTATRFLIGFHPSITLA